MATANLLLRVAGDDCVLLLRVGVVARCDVLAYNCNEAVNE